MVPQENHLKTLFPIQTSSLGSTSSTPTELTEELNKPTATKQPHNPSKKAHMDPISTTEPIDPKSFYNFRQPFEGIFCIPWFIVIIPFLTSSIILAFLRTCLHIYCPEFWFEKPNPYYNHTSKRHKIFLNSEYNQQITCTVTNVLSSGPCIRYPLEIIQVISQFLPLELDPNKNMGWIIKYEKEIKKSERRLIVTYWIFWIYVS